MKWFVRVFFGVLGYWLACFFAVVLLFAFAFLLKYLKLHGYF
ncbi:hypothetical protein HDC92_004764 [Pedobacter sp. AK017]|nr:hypothetical protein [Pedobacter sp. AK017]